MMPLSDATSVTRAARASADRSRYQTANLHRRGDAKEIRNASVLLPCSLPFSEVRTLKGVHHTPLVVSRPNPVSTGRWRALRYPFDRHIPIDAAIFCPHSQHSAQRSCRSGQPWKSSRVAVWGHILCCVLAAGAGRIEIEITHICQPRSIVAHRQYGIDLTPCASTCEPPATGWDIRRRCSTVAREGQRRRTQHNARWKEHAAAHFICRAVLEERQPLRAIHRRQVELDTGLIGQRRVPFAVSGRIALSSVSL